MRGIPLLLTAMALLMAGCSTTPPVAGPGNDIASSPSALREAIEMPTALRLEDDAAPALDRHAFLTASACDCCEPPKLGCWDPSCCRKSYVDLTGSFLPNLGLGFGGGHVIARRADAEFALEFHGTWQFVDDEAFADDGNPEAGDWYQVRAGLKIISNPKQRRHLTGRFGGVWLEANGEPNILERPGTYWGVYGAIGFETDITSRITVGPELSLMLVTPDDDFDPEPVPQFNWHLIYWLNGSGKRCLERVPYGEVYVGAAATLSPGLGGGLQFGQVFTRSSLATWSFELMAGGQDTTEDLWFDENGEYAQIRGGVKATFQPCSCGHWTGRLGGTWLRSTASNEFMSTPGDYVGAYLGLGYEWDLGSRFATGPEFTLNAIAREGGDDFEVLPQLNWHFLVKL
ncbi:MAG: hypothetical protein P1V36_04885 [Planctomycetota bacterium]|nr:hypothetical protein [Planctomycetota bacterium]